MFSTRYSLTIPTNSNSDSDNMSVTTFSNQKTTRKIDYNSKDFKFEPDEESSIYIFKNGLFTRTLLLIIKDNNRQFIIKCTM